MTTSSHSGKSRYRTEKIIRITFFCISLASIATLALITIFLFMEGLPIFKEVSVKDFVFGQYWYPTDEPPDFGIFPLIVGSIAVTGVSSVISIPLGVLTALYLAESASAGVRQWVKPIVELMAALPSVVIGFFGMVIIAPFLQEVF
ncbi:MAG: phosphate ABC transporter permease subunit PstC, partial [Desulfobacterales bacterium]|nr:phosphate ABC transporter permease subunit PstC [Desulfobacterales bacterium]